MQYYPQRGSLWKPYLHEKDEWFKNKAFTKEVKELFTDTINRYVKEESEKLSVFQQGGVYLATKKIGKNNPKAEEIKADNAARQEWNRTVDVALVEGVSEEDILKIKQEKSQTERCNLSGHTVGCRICSARLFEVRKTFYRK